MLKLWWRCIKRPKRAPINGHDIRVFSIRDGVTYSSKVVVLRLGNICVSLISISISLVSPFFPHFISPIEVSLAIVIFLAREVVSLY